MHGYALGNVRYSADPVDLGAQSDLIGAPEPMSIEVVLAAPNWRIRSQSELRAQSHSVIGLPSLVCHTWPVTSGACQPSPAASFGQPMSPALRSGPA
jgi:hypothetical protein